MSQPKGLPMFSSPTLLPQGIRTRRNKMTIEATAAERAAWQEAQYMRQAHQRALAEHMNFTRESYALQWRDTSQYQDPPSPPPLIPLLEFARRPIVPFNPAWVPPATKPVKPAKSLKKARQAV